MYASCVAIGEWKVFVPLFNKIYRIFWRSVMEFLCLVTRYKCDNFFSVFCNADIVSSKQLHFL